MSMKSVTRLILGGACMLAASCGVADDDASEGPTESVSSALSVGNIHLGDYLFHGQRLNAKNCYFSLRMQSDGNLVAYAGPGGPAIWATHTEGTAFAPTTVARFQADNNFVVISGSGKVLWSAHTEGSGSNTRLTMQNDGNVVIYKDPFGAVWASHTERAPQSWPCDQVPPTEVTQVDGNVDRPGMDLPGMPITTFFYNNQCGNACATNASCQAYTWVEQPVPAGRPQCWLKSGVPAAIARTGMVSGFKKRL